MKMGEDVTVAELGEETLVSKIVETLSQKEHVIVGPGDDCAVVEVDAGNWNLLKTDCLIEGIHFVAGTDPRLVGGKAAKRVLSDIAAMGGRPGEAVVTLAVNGEREVSEVIGWYQGMEEVMLRFGGTIVGGETAKLPGDSAVISIAMTGTVEPGKCVRRSGAALGDLILVTGLLGGSYESGRHLNFEPRLEESHWLVENHRPSSMMDLSDGLGSDLPRLVAASGVGYTIALERIPCHEKCSAKNAVSDGEDYELLMTIEPERTGSLMADWAARFPELPLTVIGEITEETPVELARGWEHYEKA